MELPDSFDLEGLIKKHPELFRLKVPNLRLDKWKQEMLSGKKLTFWVSEFSDENERKKAIESLTPDDCFRSQFRAEKDAPRSPIEIIYWGLQHIERLRKVKVEIEETKRKWLREAVIPLLSLIIGLAAIVASSLVQYTSIDSQEKLKKYELDSQEKLKKYEVSFDQRNDSYVLIMKSFESVLKSVEARNKTNFQNNLEQLESSFYKIKPFLTLEAQSRFSRTLSNYIKYMNDLFNKNLPQNFSIKEQEPYKEFKKYFDETLYKDLFERNNYVNTPVMSTIK